MSEKILFVDDETHILDSMKRQLRKRFEIVTALSGQEALDICRSEGPFAVIISDMRMPEMNGIELLSTIKEIYPDTVRMMLTGNADQETATEAVNKGQIFRFLTKPCPIPLLITSLALALRQHRLLTAERELLDQTLKGSIKVMSEILSFTNPALFSSNSRIHSLVMNLADMLNIGNRWQLEIAALMSQIGCISLPSEIINKLYADIPLSDEELEMYAKHPEVGIGLLENVPRLEGVVHIIKNQLKPFHEFSDEESSNEDLDLAAQVLKAAFDFDLLRFQGISTSDAIKRLINREEIYNPKVLSVLKKIKGRENKAAVVSIRVSEIAVGMMVEENIMAKNGTLLAPKGQVITWPILQGLVNFSKQVGVMEPVRLRTSSE